MCRAGPNTEEGCEDPWMCPEEGDSAEGRSWERQLRALGLSSLERRRLRSDLRGNVEREVLSSSPCDPGSGWVGMVQSCARGSSDWILGSISVLSR